MAKKVLVTGADGFIGSHLVEQLVDDGFEVICFCQYNSFGSYGWLSDLSREKFNLVEKILGDIRDYNSVLEAMSGTDIVMHLAALIAIPYSYIAPTSYIETNVNGTLNVLMAARTLGIERIVITSTSEVYGTAKFVPITEDHPLQAQSPYAASKIAADQLALSFHRSFDVPVTLLRPFNTYGPRQSQRAVIPTIITQLASGNKVIKLGALTPTRDFNYVSDTARSFIKVAQCDTVVGKVINSASNFEISIEDTAKLICEVMNVNAEIISASERTRPEGSEVNRLYGDNSRMLEHTGWSPVYGGLEGFRSGLTLTAKWFCNSQNLKMYSPDQYIV